MLPNVLLPNQQYNLCLEKKQMQDGVYEEASELRTRRFTGVCSMSHTQNPLDYEAIINTCRA
jgi:hypothetical protein